MARALTKKQAELIKGIKNEISKRLDMDITITDFLNACTSSPILIEITESIGKVKKIDEPKTESI
jgi:hypothetical protein